jgi:hypothetical protein
MYRIVDRFDVKWD